MKTVAIGLLGIVLIHGGAAAQTRQEQDRILGAFQQSVSELAMQQQSIDPFHGLLIAASRETRVFTPPVATVFRQVLAKTIEERAHVSHIAAVGTELPLDRHPVAFEPFPANELHEFPAVLAKALPALPRPLEYRLIGNDLVLRDADGDVIVAVLRDAVGGVTAIAKR